MDTQIPAEVKALLEKLNELKQTDPATYKEIESDVKKAFEEYFAKVDTILAQ